MSILTTTRAMVDELVPGLELIRQAVSSSDHRARPKRRVRPHRRRLASVASNGSVYFDASNNAAAGETLFNGTFTGTATSVAER